MRRLLILLICILSCGTISAQKKAQQKSAQQLIERVTNGKNLPIDLKIVSADDDQTMYNYRVEDGRLKIEGTSSVALVRGFYDYVKSNHYGLYSWSGSNIELPAELKDCPEKYVVSPVKHHYMSNVVVFGYTKPYWDWERWQKEIDWMALHGIDMPLALVGYESILARTWKEFGLSDEQINNYFVGPAHLPWMRMGNASGIDGPLNPDWYNGQVDLQHKILKRMRELGMKPICPGFPGFVPEAFGEIYPEIDIVKTSWAGAFHNWMISPENELFSQIGTEFIKQWEKEFGECEYYLVDSFNEMEIPFPPKESNERYELLASYGDKVYKSIKAGNADATWVMQGWMFGYQRNIWDYKTLEALVSEVPDDKMILLDLAVDYNKHFWHSEVNWDYYKGFYGKQWVYSIIPNMGGKTGMTGVLEFYANGQLEALRSKNRGNLIAIGMAPEGIENNEVVYELFADASWSDKEIDLREWLKNYSINRYGACPPQIEKYWDLLLKSVYGTFTDHPRYNWQFRPGSIAKGSINASEEYFQAIEAFLAAAPELKDSPLYLADVEELTALYLGGKIEQLVQIIEWLYSQGNVAGAQNLEHSFEHLMLGMDALLEQHPNLKLKNWTDFAAAHAKTPEQKTQYVNNAKRLVTIWGPPIDDYSARVWSGLIRDYYLPRWQHYFASKASGEPFNFAKWEQEWVNSTKPISTIEPIGDVVEYANKLVDYASFIDMALISGGRKPNFLAGVALGNDGVQRAQFTISAKELETIKGIRIESKNKGLKSRGFSLQADGVDIAASSEVKYFDNDEHSATYLFTVGSDTKANNGATLTIEFDKKSTTKANVEIYIVK